MNLVFASGFLVPQRLVSVEYFRGVKQLFPEALFPAVPIVGSVATRANALAAQIHAAFSAGPVHVIAHSMAGLDTRFLLANNLLGLAAPGRIVALSTVSTPHRGSPIADLLVGPEPSILDPRALSYRVLRDLAQELGIEAGALGELTSGFTRDFNLHQHDVPHVRYFSYAGVGKESFILKPAHIYCEFVGTTPEARANDGLVPLASARWGEFIDPIWPTDHLGEVGYNLSSPTLASSFDHLAAYRGIVDRVPT